MKKLKINISNNKKMSYIMECITDKYLITWKERYSP